MPDGQCDMVFDAMFASSIVGRAMGTNFRCVRPAVITIERECMDPGCSTSHVFQFCRQCYEMVRAAPDV